MRTTLVMATYNGEKYILKQLDSIKNQTCEVDEVIIGDDNSTDSTFTLISDYIENNNLKKWKIIKNKSNLGFINNFKSLLSKANNELVYLCDQDDIWELDKVEIINSIMHKNKNISLIATNFWTINNNEVLENDGENVTPFLKKKLKDKELIQINALELIDNNFAQGCTMAVRKIIADDYLNNNDFAFEHDWALAIIAAAKQGTYFYNEKLIKYRIHSNNAIGISKKAKFVDKKHNENRLNELKNSRSRLMYLMEHGYLVDMKQLDILNLRIKYIDEKKPFALINKVLITQRKKSTIHAIMGDFIYIIKN